MTLRDELARDLPERGIAFWSDKRAIDAGFDDELVSELGRCDAIVMAIGPAGLGRYQERNELNRTFDALQANSRRRLVVVRLGGAAEPAELEVFKPFQDRTASIEVGGDNGAVDQVRRSAFPGDMLQTSTDAEATLAARLISKIRTGKNLVIVVGPYAFAEAAVPLATPSAAIRGFLRSRKLRGYAPWLDVMGSIARATASDEEDAAQAVASALSVGDMESGALAVYLRLLAANWGRTPGAGRLFIVATSPDNRIDLALRSAAMPVQHLRLVHHPREPNRLFAERVTVESGRLARTRIGPDEPAFEERDRVVLIKPFGCVESPQQALLTSEHWRQAAAEMPLPDTVASHMTHAMLIALGAGAFAPSFQILFAVLLPKALADRDGNANRYLIHNPDARVSDPLHRIEASVLKTDEEGGYFQIWLSNTYKLYLKRSDPIALLSWLDHYLNQP